MNDEARALAMQVQIHRRMGGAARLELALELSDFTRALALAGFQARSPSGSATEAMRQYVESLLRADS